MTVTKKRIISVVIALLLAIVCFGFVGCSGESEKHLKVESLTASITVGSTLDNLVTGSTKLTYTYKEGGQDKTKDFTGLNKMKEAGVSIIWSGAEKVGTGTISFSYEGYVVSYDYTIVKA